MSIVSIPTFQRLILTHYQKHGRKNLPWKRTRDPYKILVSEIMLQQTQVSRVLPKYKEFLQAFPTLNALAASPDAKLLQVWQGLGYWRRAKYLKAAAQKIAGNPTLAAIFGTKPTDSGDLVRGTGIHNFSPAKRGELRKKIRSQNLVDLEKNNIAEQLQVLPGVGPYTARAVACFAFGSAEPFIDTNIRRVYLHFFFAGRRNVSDQSILRIATQAMYAKDPRTWHYALFDYGATVLTDKSINRRSRHYTKQSAFAGSLRSFRARVVRKLLSQPHQKMNRARLIRFLQRELERSHSSHTAQQVIASLVDDQLIQKTPSSYTL